MVSEQLRENEESLNRVIVLIDGQVIISREMHTVDGGVVDYSHPRGSFLTERYGEITVDLERNVYSPRRIVVVTGDALKSQSRQAIRKGSLASKGIREIPVDGQGNQHLGKDPQTGEIRTLTVKYC